MKCRRRTFHTAANNFVTLISPEERLHIGRSCTLRVRARIAGAIQAVVDWYGAQQRQEPFYAPYDVTHSHILLFIFTKAIYIPSFLILCT